MGCIYKQQGKYKKAMECHQQKIKLAEELKDKLGISLASFDIGNIYQKFKDYQQAEEYYNKAIALTIELKLENLRCRFTYHKADLYFVLQKWDKANKLNETVYNIAKETTQEEILFNSKLLSVKIEFYRDDIPSNKEMAINKLKNMLSKTEQEEEITILNYELFKMTNNIEYAKTSYSLYQKLYEEIPNIEYEEKIEELEKYMNELPEANITQNISLEQTKERELIQYINNYIDEKTQRNTEKLKIQLDKERENLTKLTRIGQAIGKELDLDELLYLMLDNVIEVTKAKRCFLMLLKNDELTFTLARNADKSSLTKEDFAISYSIPYQVLKSNKAICITNTEEETTLSGSIMELELKSIMCAPLRVQNKIIGVIYVDNRTALQEFTDNDLELFEAISDLAAVSIERAMLYKELKEKTRIEQELQIAANIQKRLLPQDLPKIKGLEVVGKVIPAKEIGGDYYDFIISDHSDKLYIAIGDVSGKGVPAGLIVAMVKSALQQLIDTYSSTQTILIKLNKIIDKNTDTTKFITFLLLKWNAKKEKLYYTGAGHEHLIIYRKNGDLEILQTKGMALGITDKIEGYLKEKELHIAYDDIIILYTDGIIEARNEKRNLLTLKHFCEIIKECYNPILQIMLENILERIKEYIGKAEQYDDMTLVIIKKC